MDVPVVVEDVEIDHIANETCYKDHNFPEGRFPTVTIHLSTGEELVGKTCACLEGHKTYGTWRVPPIGSKFVSRAELVQYLNHEIMNSSTRRG